jgi:hypothetical protein
MPKKDPRAAIAKQLMQSAMDEQQKQKMLFALPKMSDAEVADLKKELKAIADSEMWQAGKVVRGLRPERQG